MIVIGNMAEKSQFMIKLRLAADFINKNKLYSHVEIVLILRDE